MKEVVKYLALKLSDEEYERLKRRAEEEGYALVSDYVRELIARSMRRNVDNVGAALSEEELEKIVREVIEEKLDKLMNVIPQELKLDDTEVITKLERKIERKLDDMINPWTQKVDEIARRVAELQEKLEEIEEAVNELKQEREGREKEEKRNIETRRLERGEEKEVGHKEKKGERKGKLLQIFKERKVYFEGKDLSWAKDKERIIDILRRHGAIVLNTAKYGRIIVHPDAWEEFLSALESASSGSDEEVYSMLEDEKLRELFNALRSEGILYYDSGERRWRFTEGIEE